MIKYTILFYILACLISMPILNRAFSNKKGNVTCSWFIGISMLLFVVSIMYFYQTDLSHQ